MGRNDRPLLEAISGRIGQIAPLSIYLAVPKIEARYAHTIAQGTKIMAPLWKTPWELQQFSLEDKGGQLLSFHNG